MATLSELMVKLSLDMSNFESQMKQVGKSTQKISDKMSSAGQGLTRAVTVPVGIAGGAIVKLGSDFEASLSNVQAVTGSSAKDMEALKNMAKDLGSTTKFSGQEAADGMAYLGMAGFDTQQIMKAMPGMLDLAAAGNLDLARTADIASNILTGFGLSADKSGHAADVLAYASSNANTDVTQLGEAMKYLAPTAKSLGWGLEESTAAVMALSDAGIQGEQAGAAFGTSLTRLAAPSKQAADLMNDLGLEFFDAEGKMKSLPEVMSVLETGLDGMTDKQKAATLSTIFGAEAYKSWSVLLDKGSDALGENTTALEQADGKAKEMATTMGDNLQGKFKQLTSVMSGVAYDIYDLLLPSLTKIVEKAIAVVQWFGGLDDSTKKVITVIGLLAAAIGPLLVVLATMVSGLGFAITQFGVVIGTVGKVIGIFSKLKTAMSLTKVLPLIMSPAGLIIAGLTALIAVGVLVWKNWDTIKAYAIKIWGAISEWFSTTLESLTTFFSNAWATISDTTSSVLSSVGKFFSDTWTSISNATTKAFNAVKDFLVKWGSKLISFFPLGKLVLFFIKNWEEIKKFLDITMRMIKALMQVAWNFITDKIITPITNAISNVITKTWTSIKDKTSSIFNAVSSVVSSIWTSVYNKISSIVSKVYTWVKSKFDAVKTATQNAFNSARDLATSAFTTLWSKVTSTAGKIYSTLRDKFNSAKKAITDPIEDAKDTVIGIVEKIKGAFSRMKITIPKPKIPKITVSEGSKKVAGVSIPFPKIGVQWNAKGGIFNGASILGGGQGVGEAGAEAVLPIQHKRYMKPFSNAVASHLAKVDDGSGEGGVTNHIEVSQLVVREEADVKRIAQELYDLQRRGNRGKGRG